MRDICTVVYSSSCHDDTENLYPVLSNIFSRNKIEINPISDKDAVNNPALLSDPFLLLDSVASVNWIEKMTPLCAHHRAITNQSLNQHFTRLSTVTPAYLHIVDTCMAYLSQLGITRVAFFGFDKRHFTSITIMQSFSHCSIKHPPVCSEDVYWNDVTLLESASQLLQNVHRYDAIIAVNAGSAAFIAQKLFEADIRIPEDIKIIALSDRKLLSMMTPSISAFTVSEKDLYSQLLSVFQFLRKHTDVFQFSTQIEAVFHARASTGFIKPKTEIPSVLISPKLHNIPPSGHEKVNMFINLFEECDKTDLTILYGLTQSMKREDIAAQAHISISTANYRIQSMLKKTASKSVYELLAFLKAYNIY